MEINKDKWGTNQTKRALDNYAEDLVVFADSREDAESAIQIQKKWQQEEKLTVNY